MTFVVTDIKVKVEVAGTSLSNWLIDCIWKYKVDETFRI